MQARDIMTKDVVAVGPDTLVSDIARVMHERNISGVPVVDEARRVIGIITELDMITRNTRLEMPSFIQILDLARIPVKMPRHYQDRLRHILGTRAGDLMTREVVTSSPDIDVQDLAEIMVERGCNPIPIVQDEVLVGIVSRADLIQMMAHQFESEVSSA